MLDEFIKEINRLKEIEKQYGYLQKDKQRMSDELFKLMMFKYDSTPFIDRKAEYIEEVCSMCRFEDYCEKDRIIPKDVGKPIPSDKSWLPSTTTCGKFKWD